MTRRLGRPSTHVSGLAKLIAGDNSCLFSIWFKSWHRDYETSRDGSGLAEWNARHTSAVHELADRLERQGDSVHMEMQNWFEVRSSITGSIVIGKPDIIGRGPDGAATVYDVKTGRPRAADEIQVKLYMYLLPVSNHGRWRRARMDGCVVYADGTEVPIGADAIDDEFKGQVAGIMRRIVSEEPARHVPSERECGWCELTAADCSERIEADSPENARPRDTLHSC